MVYNNRQKENGNGFSCKGLRDIDKTKTMDAKSWRWWKMIIKVKSATSKGYEIAKEGDSIPIYQTQTAKQDEGG